MNKQKITKYKLSIINRRIALLLEGLFSICITYLAIPHVFLPRSIRIYPSSPHVSPKIIFEYF